MQPYSQPDERAHRLVASLITTIRVLRSIQVALRFHVGSVTLGAVGITILDITPVHGVAMVSVGIATHFGCVQGRPDGVAFGI